MLNTDVFNNLSCDLLNVNEMPLKMEWNNVISQLNVCLLLLLSIT